MSCSLTSKIITSAEQGWYFNSLLNLNVRWAMVRGPTGRDTWMSGEGGGCEGGVDGGATFRRTVSSGTVRATNESLPTELALPLNMFIKSPIEPPPLDPPPHRSLSKSVKLEPRRTLRREPEAVPRFGKVCSMRTSASLVATFRLRNIFTFKSQSNCNITQPRLHYH